MKASYHKYILNFIIPGGTSRGVLNQKETWFIKLSDGLKTGIGETGLFRGLSFDDNEEYEEKLKWLCDNINLGFDVLYSKLSNFPSIRFGLETAFISLKSDSPFNLFPSAFSNGTSRIPINGLVWMGDKTYMISQIRDKIESGFTCIKLKIGALDFATELDVLRYIRSEFSESDIEIRVDANGAFSPDQALERLNQLSVFNLHSIEQPIKQGQYEDMAALCKKTPLAIALDEELIGVYDYEFKKKLIDQINPQYIILKPSLVGGFMSCDEWISIANNNNIGWWITSALESNIGLNAIAQYTYNLNSNLPQGLGTGSLFSNNFSSPLEVNNGFLSYNCENNWSVNF